MLTLLKVSAAKPGNQAAAEEKIAALEEKKRSEEYEMNTEMASKKQQAVGDIKAKFNAEAAEVKIDFTRLKEALRCIGVAASSAKVNGR
jgi:hypothetical protein